MAHTFQKQHYYLVTLSKEVHSGNVLFVFTKEPSDRDILCAFVARYAGSDMAPVLVEAMAESAFVKALRGDVVQATITNAANLVINNGQH